LNVQMKGAEGQTSVGEKFAGFRKGEMRRKNL